jgi:ribosomal-protein-alanine N-acetyltransferase
MDLPALPYLVQPMRADDIPTVSAIEQAVFASPWSESAFRSELAHHDTACYLILRYALWAPAPAHQPRNHGLPRQTQDPALDASLLGYGGFWRVVDEGHICTLAVRPAWRGRGLGELLLLSLIEAALRAGAEVMTLEVRVNNLAAQSLYAKYGFERVGRRKAYYAEDHEDAWIMTTGAIRSAAYRRALAELRARLRQRLLAQDNTPPEPDQAHQLPTWL